VWVGNFDRAPLIGSSGVTGAGPIFHAVMLAAEARVAGTITASGSPDVVEAPPDLVGASICALSGMRAHETCPIKRREHLAADSAVISGPACTWHHDGADGVVTIWPARYRAWADANGLRSPQERQAARRLPAAVRQPTSQAAATGLHVTSPAEGTVFLIDPTLRPEFQAVPLRAMGGGDGPVSWTVNGRAIGSAKADAALHWPLERGRHRAVVRDGRGQTAEVSFVVR
jgi:penicillin-binding protein 1C